MKKVNISQNSSCHFYKTQIKVNDSLIFFIRTNIKYILH